MKINNIIKFAGLALLVVVASTSCENKKKKAEAERLAAEAAARAEAERLAAEEAARLAARVFEINDTVTLLASDTVAESAEAYQEALLAAKKATAYGSDTFALPTAGILYASERCDLNAETKALLDEFVAAWHASNKTAKILVEAYSNDTKDSEYNHAIAIERSNLAVMYLKYKKVSPKSIEVVCPCKSRKAEGCQRRVNVSIK